MGVSGVSGTDKLRRMTTTRLYDPLVAGSGTDSGTTGFYQIEITFGASTGMDFVLYNDIGDANQFRDQGQMLIQGNTIAQFRPVRHRRRRPGTRDGPGRRHSAHRARCATRPS